MDGLKHFHLIRLEAVLDLLLVEDDTGQLIFQTHEPQIAANAQNEEEQDRHQVFGGQAEALPPDLELQPFPVVPLHRSPHFVRHSWLLLRLVRTLTSAHACGTLASIQGLFKVFHAFVSSLFTVSLWHTKEIAMTTAASRRRRVRLLCAWVLGALLGLMPSALVAINQCASNYTGKTATNPSPANFRAYRADSPWNLPLPANPLHVDPSSQFQANIKHYGGTGNYTYITTPHSGYYTLCDKTGEHSNPGDPPRCDGTQGFSMWIATTQDVPVTFKCDPARTNYGCSAHDSANYNQAWTYQGYAPKELQALCQDSNPNFQACGDHNWGLMQPDGTVIEFYHCSIYQNIIAGDVIGLSTDNTVCNKQDGNHNPNPNTFGGSGALNHVTQDKGINDVIASGPPTMQYWVTYNELVVAQDIRHTITFHVGCVAPNYRFPATSDVRICSQVFPSSPSTWDGRGVPTGARFYLNMSDAEIDTVLNANPGLRAMRPIYIALRKYGGYLMDTGGGKESLEGILLEEQTQQFLHNVASGWETNNWFQDNLLNAGWSYQGWGSPRWTSYGFPFVPFGNNFVLLQECYAYGTCSDSPPPEPSTAEYCGGTFTCPTPCCAPNCPSGCPVSTSGCQPTCPVPCCEPSCPAGCALNCPPPAVTEAGPLIAQWHFDENAGTVAVDTTQVANNLTLTPGPVWVAGHSGTSALSCTGSGGAFTTTMPLPTPPRYSWNFWGRASTLPTNATQVQQFWDAATGAGGNDAFGFNWGTLSPTSNLAAYHRLANGDYITAMIPTSIPIAVNVWYNFGATYDGTLLKVFFNGTAVAQTPATSMLAPTGTFSVCDRWPGGGTASIDELQVWNVALSESEMRTAMLSTTAHPVRRRHLALP
jgi:hypothetical protein